MRKTAAILAAAVLGLAGVSANADILVSSVRSVGVVGSADDKFDIVRFYAQLSPGGAEVQAGATGLFLAGITMSSTGEFKFGFIDKNSDSIPDWDPVRLNATSGGTAASPLTNNSTTSTFIAPRPYDKPAANQGDFSDPQKALAAVYPLPFQGDGKTPAQASNDVDGDGTLSPGDFDPKTIYQSPLVQPGSPGLKSFRVEAFNSTLDTSAAPGDPNYARGALFAVAVVPHGASVRIQGTQTPNFNGGLEANQGNIQQVDFTDGVPEPTSLGLLGVIGAGILGRRSRRA